jgi:hypothetical protein
MPKSLCAHGGWLFHPAKCMSSSSVLFVPGFSTGAGSTRCHGVCSCDAGGGWVGVAGDGTRRQRRQHGGLGAHIRPDSRVPMPTPLGTAARVEHEESVAHCGRCINDVLQPSRHRRRRQRHPAQFTHDKQSNKELNRMNSHFHEQESK